MSKTPNLPTMFRNACTHGERFFSYKTKDGILDLPLHAKFGNEKRENQYIYGKHDLFAVVISFRYLLPDEFEKDLTRIVDDLDKECGSLKIDALLEYMGFPKN